MADNDAEWVGVDYEFGKPKTPTTARPVVRPNTRPPPTYRPQPPPQPATEPAVEAPEVEGRSSSGDSSVAVVAGTVGGVLGVVLLLLLLYMVVLRRKLIKAKHSGKESKYQLRVEDVAHITNLDETSNTYVNTTDLQKLVATVRAKGKSTERVPTPPRMVHQTPTPYKPPLGPHSSVHPTQGEKNSFLGEGDVVLVKAPMPLPYSSLTTNTCSIPTREQPKQDVIYCNLQETQPAPHLSPLTNTTTTPPRSKVEAPRIAPPPPPAKMNSVPLLNYQDDRSNSGPVSPTIIARPAPAPPAVAKSQRNDAIPTPSPTQKPTPPPVSHKPSKGPRVETISPTQAPAPVKPTVPKPMPPTLPKPGVSKKGKDLPPLKMAPFPFIKSWKQHVSTPDTSIIELTPDSTPTTESVGSGSISAKIAFLEGKMKTPSRATGPRT